MVSFSTFSGKQTADLASILAKELLEKKVNKEKALVLALSGNLGAGKTTFAKGLVNGFGVNGKITSPTFVVIKNYKIRDKNYTQIYHIDCYRLKKTRELFDLGFKNNLDNPKNVIIIEWPEKFRRYLPKNTIWLKFKYGKKENERIIEIKIK